VKRRPSARTMFWALAGVLTLSGCVVGPRYVAPTPPAAAKGAFVSAQGASALDQPLPPRWWRLYNDPVLDRLVEQALVENEDLKVAAANLAYAQGLLDEARAGRFPTTSLAGGPAYGVSTTAAAAGESPNFSYSAAFTASYDFDLFGRIRRAIQSAKANAEAVLAAEDAVRVTVAAETAGAYANICGDARQIAVARASLALVQETYDITLKERNAGALSDFDLAREAVLLEQAKAAIPPLEGQRRFALFTLAALIGKTPAEVPADAAACQAPPTLARPLPVGDGAALLRRRPDLREAERSLAAATARIGVAAADLYPTVTLGGSVNPFGALSGPGAGASLLAYSIGPLITWTFPNILVARAHVKEASAQASAALAAFDGSVLTALQETEQALATYAAELDHHVALTAARDRADEAVRLAKVQSLAGTLSFLDLLQVQSTAVAADQALAASDQAVSADQVAVFQALGGGWEDAPAVIAPPIPKR
jgi:NodT family efflux transporter outer membrane factor (OMF) lipoprotein